MTLQSMTRGCREEPAIYSLCYWRTENPLFSELYPHFFRVLPLNHGWELSPYQPGGNI